MQKAAVRRSPDPNPENKDNNAPSSIIPPEDQETEEQLNFVFVRLDNLLNAFSRLDGSRGHGHISDSDSDGKVCRRKAKGKTTKIKQSNPSSDANLPKKKRKRVADQMKEASSDSDAKTCCYKKKYKLSIADKDLTNLQSQPDSSALKMKAPKPGKTPSSSKSLASYFQSAKDNNMVNKTESCKLQPKSAVDVDGFKRPELPAKRLKPSSKSMPLLTQPGAPFNADHANAQIMQRGKTRMEASFSVHPSSTPIVVD